MTLAFPLVQVDAFTSTPYRGNPAAVCLLTGTRDTQWMQELAQELNLAATVFLIQEGDAYILRWFSPTTELALCGHGTLAAMHVLEQYKLLNQGEDVRFQTKSGILTARCNDGWIEINFPAERAEACEAPPQLLQSLAVTPLFTGRNRLDYLIEVSSEAELAGISPDLSELSLVETRGVIVTARSTSPEYSFVSRFFAPRAGIPEDPVTGSAHCCLAPYWSEKLTKTEMLGYQASRRGGTVRVRLAGDRVYLGGQAVTVMQGNVLIYE